MPLHTACLHLFDRFDVEKVFGREVELLHHDKRRSSSGRSIAHLFPQLEFLECDGHGDGPLFGKGERHGRGGFHFLVRHVVKDVLERCLRCDGSGNVKGHDAGSVHGGGGSGCCGCRSRRHAAFQTGNTLGNALDLAGQVFLEGLHTDMAVRSLQWSAVDAFKGIKVELALKASVSCLLGKEFWQLFSDIKNAELEEHQREISPWERQHLLLNV